MDGELISIVIIEDDAGLCRAMERLFRLSGFVTRSFHSAEDAGMSQYVASAHCLVVDIQLPGASGPAFYGTLHAPRPPIVFITAFDAPATRHAVASAGNHALLAKPFLGAALLKAVDEAMRRND
ncbi:response regulator [Paraburkholderia sp. Ac-20340]|uniref:response regulator n=1 Tax=Paraburkholderia sp. Ac-20340 TaxID=2703888 RepID=UPI00197D9787|nr:response regulator [Paraburkholderia sp. Ac-20340]MBN3855072.1 response regulator [Paraburkholderia sp. Ac-20340]